MTLLRKCLYLRISSMKANRSSITCEPQLQLLELWMHPLAEISFSLLRPNMDNYTLTIACNLLPSST